MPILNYTTKIGVHKTLGQIQEILAKAGATAIATDYDNGIPIAVMFVIKIKDQSISFRLPCNYHGVYLKLCEDKVSRSLRNEEQAQRVAWRIIKDWIEAQLAIVEANQAEIAEVFLPYAITQSGRTLYQEFTQGNLLGMGETNG